MFHESDDNQDKEKDQVSNENNEVSDHGEEPDEESVLTRGKAVDTETKEVSTDHQNESNERAESQYLEGEYNQDYDKKEVLAEDEKEESIKSDDSSQTCNNTIDSENTTVNQTKQEMDKIKELPSVRYQFSFLLEDVNLEQLREEQEGKKKETIKDPVKLIKSMLVTIYTKLLEFDSDFKLLTWSSNSNKGPKYMKLAEPTSIP